MMELSQLSRFSLFALVCLCMKIVDADFNFNDPKCEGCNDAADDYQSCIMESCADENGEQCIFKYGGTESLAACCEADCDDEATKVQSCLDECLPSCAEESTSKYLSCMYNSWYFEECEGSECVASVIASTDAFTKQVETREDFFSGLEESVELYGSSCKDTIDNSKTVCGYSDLCCTDCTGYLSDFLDCTINDIFRDAMDQIYGGIGSCKVDCGDLLGSTGDRNRKLMDEEGLKNGGKSKDDAAYKEGLENLLNKGKDCKMQTLEMRKLTNLTKNGENSYASCVLKAGMGAIVGNYSAFDDAEEGVTKKSEMGSSAFAVAAVPSSLIAAAGWAFSVIVGL